MIVLLQHNITILQQAEIFYNIVLSAFSITLLKSDIVTIKLF